MNVSTPSLTVSPSLPQPSSSPNTAEEGRLGEHTTAAGTTDQTGSHFHATQNKVNEAKKKIEEYLQATLSCYQDTLSREFDKYPYAKVSKSLRKSLAETLPILAPLVRKTPLSVYRKRLYDYLRTIALPALPKPPKDLHYLEDVKRGQMLFLMARCLQQLTRDLRGSAKELDETAFAKIRARPLKVLLASEALKTPLFCLHFSYCVQACGALFFTMRRDSLPIDELALLTAEIHQLNKSARKVFLKNLTDEERFEQLSICVLLASMTNQSDTCGCILLAGLLTASSGYSRMRVLTTELQKDAKAKADEFMVTVTGNALLFLNSLPKALEAHLLKQDAPEIPLLDLGSIPSPPDFEAHKQKASAAHQILSNLKPKNFQDILRTAFDLIGHSYYFKASYKNERVPASSKHTTLIFAHLVRYGNLLIQMHRDSRYNTTEKYLYSLMQPLGLLSQSPVLKRAIDLLNPQQLAAMPPIKKVQILDADKAKLLPPALALGTETALSYEPQTQPTPKGIHNYQEVVPSLLNARRSVSLSAQILNKTCSLDRDTVIDLPSLHLKIPPQMLRKKGFSANQHKQIPFLHSLFETDCDNTENCFRIVSVLFTRHAVAAFLKLWEDYSFTNHLDQRAPSPVASCVTSSERKINGKSLVTLHLPETTDIQLEMHPSIAKDGVFDLHYSVTLKPPAWRKENLSSDPDRFGIEDGTATYSWKISVRLMDKKTIAISPIRSARQEDEPLPMARLGLPLASPEAKPATP